MSNTNNIEKYVAKLIGGEEVELRERRVNAVEDMLCENIIHGSAEEKEYLQSPDKLHGDKLMSGRTQARQKEGPTHRMAVLLKAQGRTNREIAEALDVNENTIAIVLRTPWARMRLLDEINRAARPGIQALLEAEAPKSVLTLIEMRDNEKAKPSERITAANSLLDRFLGKPAQTVTSVTVKGPDLSTKELIEQELEELKKQEKALVGN